MNDYNLYPGVLKTEETKQQILAYCRNQNDASGEVPVNMPVKEAQKQFPGYTIRAVRNAAQRIKGHGDFTVC